MKPSAQDDAGADEAAPKAEQRSSAVAKLADGVELIGEYEDSGFKEAPYLVRRADGQVIQVPRLLFLVAEQVDGQRGVDEIAESVSESFGRGVSADNVRTILDEKLMPLGILVGPDGKSPKLQRVDPMLALKFRAALIPEGVVRAITSVFYPLFFPPVVLAVVAGLIALDVWLFAIHGVAQSARDLAYQPVLLLMVLGLVVVSAAFHECGHATACRYGGAKPGVMGAGIYIVWPAFYTDVTDAYRLGRGGRLRTDLGGIYFNAIFTIATYGAYFLTGFEPLLIVVVLQHLEMLHQLLPFLRLDGYYIVSDLTGVPDMFARIKPTLKSLVPWTKTADSVRELKPWARTVVTVYVLLLVPILAVVFGFMVISIPRIVATCWDSLFVQLDKTGDAFGDGKIAGSIAGIVQLISLVLPLAGMAMTLSRAGRGILYGAWNWSEDSIPRRSFVSFAVMATAAAAAFVLAPNGEYKPLQPGERGTVQGGVAAISEVPSGRPSLTEKREEELGGAPTERARREEADPAKTPADENKTTTTETGTGPTRTEPTPTTTEPTPTEPTPTTTTP